MKSVDHILNPMLDQIIDHLLDHIIINLITTTLHFDKSFQDN